MLGDGLVWFGLMCLLHENGLIWPISQPKINKKWENKFSCMKMEIEGQKKVRKLTYKFSFI